MTLTRPELEKIVKTLPIGYYISRNVEITIDENAECSSYDPMNDKIEISMKQINTGLESLQETGNEEEIVRSNLYHEVSHAFLTPTSLHVDRTMNIVEDERIESILRKYYMNVNFRKTIMALNNYHGEAPIDAESAFYHLVRFRVGDPKWIAKLNELIDDYKTLNRSSYSYSYACAAHNFHDEFVNEWNKMNAQNMTEPNPIQANGQNGQDSAEAQQTTGSQDGTQPIKVDAQNDDNSDDQPDTNAIQSDETCEQEGEQQELNESIYDDSYAKAMIESVMNEFNDNEISAQIQSILQRIAKASSRNGSAINAYSGKFDPRAVVRDDYKYFVQANRTGHIKAYSRTHLNLFIDRSGSFKDSEDTVNKLIKALSIFEKSNPEFTFTLITCGDGERIEPINHRKLDCRGGNRLDSEIFQIFRQVQRPNESNYNIVLFDGDAFSNCGRYDRAACRPNFGAFNNSKTTIISDYDNREVIERYAKSAKHIFTADYVDELIKNVMIALQALTR